MPHLQDTGGFFVAALRKVHHLPGSKEAREEQKLEEQKNQGEEKKDETIKESKKSYFWQYCSFK